MADTAPTLRFAKSFNAQPGTAVRAGPGIVRVTARNSGPFTFTGTNSFIIGKDAVFVLDPGPNDKRHLEALTAAIARRPVVAVLLSHGHRDHSALAGRLARATGAPIWSGAPPRRGRGRTDRQLRDGDWIAAGGSTLEVIATPGHSESHLCFALVGTPAILTGDHVMGWNSTMIAPPDGDMGDYLSSLDKLIARPEGYYIPAHGGPIPEGRDFAVALRAHRQMRNGQIVRLVEQGADTRRRLIKAIYPGLSGRLRIAASMTLRAHLSYLAAQGRIEMQPGPLGPKLLPGKTRGGRGSG